ncbi:class I SAM-dependent methyltransferase [Sulfuracidifex metallicus]|uniref:class I SAM-dependent methyltransferase n=1 Tax=Sulfuracidifex metallicus TaxID=47303 RepID=UPI0022741C42|nr:methyltransferase [Sulfuracidifex metallicus]MCY0849471.1 methyltransferase [Sulfuracidifex metallicus]
MVFCIKVDRKEYNKVIRQVKVDPSYSPIFQGNSVYIPVLDYRSYQVEECEPKPKSKPKKLSHVVPGLRSFYIIGEIALITEQGDKDYDAAASHIMEIYKKVRSVYLRRKVSGQLRVNEVELIRGVDNPVTEYKEAGIRFLVDVSKVYVNPSMSNERIRVRDYVKEGPVLDAFAGYGPFSLLIAKKNVRVVSGDLNLDGLILLKESAILNKLDRLIDILQYDSSFLPFRDSAFNLVIADNPTMVEKFKAELCRVGKEVIFYVLSKNEEEASEKIFPVVWSRVNDYAKDLFIFKGTIRCNDIGD